MIKVLAIMLAFVSLLLVLGFIFPQQRDSWLHLPRAERAAGGNPRVIEVKPGENLQAVVNAALPGDTIVLRAGASYTGNLTLPRKAGSAYITIQSSRVSELAENVRVSPRQTALFARLQSQVNGTPIIRTEPGAHHYRFVGIEMSTANATIPIFNLVELGSAAKEQNNLAVVPHDLIFDRCYLHGFATQQVQRGIALNSGETSILNSWISDIHWDIDTQALCGWNGPGPFHIVNNHLEAAGENVLFGGARVNIPNMVPSDIEIRGNHFFKPLLWKVGDASYAGHHWSVKNSFELKNARRVIVEGNFFENCWSDGQTGIGIVLTPRADPFATVQDVTFVNNVVRNMTGGVNLLGRDNEAPTRTDRQKNIRIVNNLFEQIGNEPLLQVNGVEGLVFDHNTCFHRGNIVTAYGEPSPRFVLTNNIVAQNQYGIVTDGGVPLGQYFPGAVIRRNAIVGGAGSALPDNFAPARLDDLKFIDVARRNYQLLSASSFRGKGTDGKDVGCDFSLLRGAFKSREQQ
jgi:hypothetical protein